MQQQTQVLMQQLIGSIEDSQPKNNRSMKATFTTGDLEMVVDQTK
ncbi:MAG: hypothetical protein R3A43_11050 [Bacteroidia bacterium]